MIRFLFGVSSDVTCKMVPIAKPFCTIVTMIRFLFVFSVSSDMMCKSATVSKALLTQITLIRFFFSVSSDVTFKMTILSKALLAMVTLIRFLFGVSSDVISKLAAVRIALLAISTLITFVPCLMLRLFMMNPLLFTITLVKRKATVSLSPHKLLLVSQHMHFKFVKTIEVYFTKLTGKRS